MWLDGTTDEDRAELDAFYTCLLHGSSLNHYFGGEAELHYRGSAVVPPPVGVMRYHESEDWLGGLLESGALRPDPEDDHTVLVVNASAVNIRLGGEACGRSDVVTVGDHTLGVAFVRNYPLCWPTHDRVRTETQVGMHELVEVTDRLLGYAGCAGDGVCEGKSICRDRCDGFVGLTCDGAPEKSWTGCSGGRVDGWVIQRLASDGREQKNCETCMPCDFTPEACPPDQPDCSAAPPRAAKMSGLGWVGLVGALAGLGLTARRLWTA